ncbi:MAG: hypothetical protein ACKOPI_06620, partial [bacterium]
MTPKKKTSKSKVSRARSSKGKASGGSGAPAITPAFFASAHGWPYLLVPFIVIAIVLELNHAAPALVFAASAL